MNPKSEILVLRKVEPVRAEEPGFPLGGKAAGQGPAFGVEVELGDEGDLRDLRQEPDVLAAAEVVPMRLHRPVERRDPAPRAPAEEIWGLPAVGADDTSCSGIGVTVAILDTGIDADHEAFREARGRIVEMDFSGDGNGDRDGHGTHCAGTVFGGRVAGHAIGVAPNVERILIGKVIGRGDSSSARLARAIDWAIRDGAHVISMSLGMDHPGFVRSRVEAGYPADVAAARAIMAFQESVDFFSAITRQAKYCGRPVIFVAAAGNASRYNENPEYVLPVEPPAAATGFLSVGALRRSKPGRYEVAWFSNGGARLAAPGVEVLSARAGTTADLALMSGTSMAVPHVAGVTALWIEHLAAGAIRRLTSQFVIDEIEAHARRDVIDPPRVHDAGRGLVKSP
jgi:subtilisin family serine protease